MFQRILIANRGEIALRVIRACREMGIGTVAVFSEADRGAAYLDLADEKFCIGPASATDSYLKIERIISAAEVGNADAIHPGYGFLSENPDFVDQVTAAGLVFIGPSSAAIRAMGLKDAAKRLMSEAGVPVVPGYHGADQDPGHLAEEAGRIGWPVLIKAAIRDADPVLFFEHKYLYRRIKATMPAGDHVVPLGKARVARAGTDVSIVTYAATVWKALEAAEELARDGISVEVIDLRTLLPLDNDAIVATVKKTNRVLVVHEDTVTGGIGGEITARINELCFEWLDAPVRRVAAHDIPLPYAPPLEDFVLPQTSDIVRAARWLAAY